MELNEALGMAGFVEVLSVEVRKLQEETKAMARYIEEAQERHDQYIAELDEIIRESGELLGDVRGLHDRMIENWPKKPYFMRRNW